MSITRDVIRGAIVADDIPESLCWGSPQEFIKRLESLLAVRLPISDNEEFVIVGFTVPSEDDKSKLWVRTASNGAFLGFYMFQTGSWKRIHNYRSDEVIWMQGDSREIPDGFQLIDGTVASIPVDVQNHIKSFYLVDTTIVAFPVYKYFATIWIGY